MIAHHVKGRPKNYAATPGEAMAGQRRAERSCFALTFLVLFASRQKVQDKSECMVLDINAIKAGCISFKIVVPSFGKTTNNYIFQKHIYPTCKISNGASSVAET